MTGTFGNCGHAAQPRAFAVRSVVTLHMERVYEFPIDFGLENVGLAVLDNMLVHTTAFLNAVTLNARAERAALNIMASESQDTSRDAIRGPARVTLLKLKTDALHMLCAEFGNQWARLIDISHNNGISGGKIVREFTAGGLGVFAVDASFGLIVLCARSEEPEDASTHRIWVYDADTFELLRSGVAPVTHGAQWNSVLKCQLLDANTALITLRGYASPVILNINTWESFNVELTPSLPEHGGISAIIQNGSRLYAADMVDNLVWVYESNHFLETIACPKPVDVCCFNQTLYVLTSETNDARVLGFVEPLKVE